jgi:hypothetical protein
MPGSIAVATLLAALAAAAARPAPAAAALPVVHLEVGRAVPNEPKIGARMRMPGYTGRIGIERRGQSSLRLFPKQSYAIELRDARGEDRKVPLLGMPDDGDWILYGPYNDKTLMRNVLAYGTARFMGRYAARTRFVELRLDGRHQGVYVLMEKLELGDDRVQGDALLELTFNFQARSKGPFFRTPVRRRPVVWEDPERGDLSRKRANAIAARINAAERGLYRRGSWRDKLDEASAIDFALVNELFKNQDALHASTFMALRGGKVHLGPVWDFDISSGNSDYGESRRLRGWMLRHKPWAQRLYRDRRFTHRMAARWRELRRAGLRRHVLRTIARSERRLHGALGRNFARWPVLDRRIWPNPRARGSFGAETRHLRSWMKRRIAWIDRNVSRL